MANALQKGRKKSRRIVPQRKAGIPKDADGAYWRGTRAETIVSERAEKRRTEREAKKAAKASSRRSSRGDDAPRAKRTKTPSQQLKRLQRQLARRKTLAGRQSVETRIRQLEAQLAAGAPDQLQLDLGVSSSSTKPERRRRTKREHREDTGWVDEIKALPTGRCKRCRARGVVILPTGRCMSCSPNHELTKAARA